MFEFKFPQPVEPSYARRYAVMEGDCFVFSERFITFEQASEFAKSEAMKYPGDKYYVIFLDSRVVATQPKPTVTVTSTF